MVHCWAAYCDEKKTKGSSISFHRFPTDIENYSQWCKMLKEGLIPNEHSKFCSKHFTSDCFKESRSKRGKELQKGAIPTIWAAEHRLPNQSEPFVSGFSENLVLTNDIEMRRNNDNEIRPEFRGIPRVHREITNQPGITEILRSRITEIQRSGIAEIQSSARFGDSPNRSTFEPLPNRSELEALPSRPGRFDEAHNRSGFGELPNGIWESFSFLATLLRDYKLFLIIEKNNGNVVLKQRIYSQNDTQETSSQTETDLHSAPSSDHPVVESVATNTSPVSAVLPHAISRLLSTDVSKDGNCQNESAHRGIEPMAAEAFLVVRSPSVISSPSSRTNVIVSKETNMPTPSVCSFENKDVPTIDSGIEICSLSPSSERSSTAKHSLENSHSVATTPVPARHGNTASQRSKVPSPVAFIVNHSSPLPGYTISPASSTASIISARPDSYPQEVALQDTSIWQNLPISVPDGLEKITLSSLLMIKACPLVVQTHNSKSFNGFIPAPNCTDLMSCLIHEKYLLEPFSWLSKKHLLLELQSCYDCSRVLKLIPGKTDESDFQWTCVGCEKKRPFHRPSVYDRFPDMSISDLLVLTYHWAVQSDFDIIVKDLFVPLEEASCVWNSLRQFCSETVLKQNERLGGGNNDNIVEMAVVRFGEFVIVGAMERTTKFTRLKAYPVTVGYMSRSVQNEVESWLLPHTSVVSVDPELKKIQKEGLVHISHGPEENREESAEFQVRHIVHYLKSRLKQIFGRYTTSTMKLDIFQGCLEELQWRERWGHDGTMAFWNMLHFLFGKRYDKACPLPASHPFNMFPETSNSSVPSESQSTRQEVSSRQTNDTEARMDVDEQFQPIIPKPEPYDDENTVPSYSDASSNDLIESPIPSASCKIELPMTDEVAEPSVTETSSDDQHFIANIPTVPEGSVEVSAQKFLEVKTWPLPPADGIQLSRQAKEKIQLEAKNLENDLTERDLFLCPVKWIMASTNLFPKPENLRCTECGGDSFLFHIYQSIDEFAYTCVLAGCRGRIIFRRPDVFSKFGMPLPNVILLMYHWAIQSDTAAIMLSVLNSQASKEERPMTTMSLASMTEDEIWSFYRVLQDACATPLSSRMFLIGGSATVVEANIIKFGIFYLLGALDRNTRMFRLKVFPITSGWDLTVFGKVLEQWLLPKTILVTPFEFQLKDNDITHCLSHADSPLNDSEVTEFLKKIISYLFGQFCTALIPIERIQGFLDEIQWRQRIGHSFSSAFFNMLTLLIKLYGRDDANSVNLENNMQMETIENRNDAPHTISTTISEESFVPIDNVQSTAVVPATDANLNQFIMGPCVFTSTEPNVASSPSVPLPDTSAVMPASTSRPSIIKVNSSCRNSATVENFTKTPSLSGVRRSSSSTNPKASKRPKLSAADSVNELRYYSRKGDMSNFSSRPGQSNINSLFYRCDICKRSLAGNFNVINHVMQHYEEKRKARLGREIFCQCKHCYAEFMSNNDLVCHVKTIHMSVNTTSCLLCSKLFVSRAALLEHLQNKHVEYEMPYCCKICSFRSSLYIDIKDHFFHEHYHEPELMCFLCLKIFPVEIDPNGFFGTVKFAEHVMQHHIRPDDKLCEACTLNFLTHNEVVAHRLRDHVSFSTDDDITPFTDKVPLYNKKGPSDTGTGSPIPPMLDRPHNHNSLGQSLGSMGREVVPSMLHINLMNPDVLVPEKVTQKRYNCIECGNLMHRTHFSQFLCKCRYRTNCSLAFYSHVSMIHKQSTKKSTDPYILKNKLFCRRCRFSTRDGCDMASHCAKCSGVCYEKKMPTQSLPSSSSSTTSLVSLQVQLNRSLTRIS